MTILNKLFISVLLLLFITLTVTSKASAYTITPTNEQQRIVDEKIFEGLKQLHNGNYIKTLDTFQEVITLEPNHPVGYFFYAAALQWLITDYRNYDYIDIFLEYIDLAINKATDMIDADKENPWGHFYHGAALGFRGVYYSDVGSFFKAFRDGTKSYNILKKAKKYEPNLYDIYYGIGLYDFYKAYYLEKFLWLGKGTKTKQDGINSIYVTIEKGKYAVVEAKMILIRVYYENEQFDEATETAEKLVAEFPNYLFGLWFLARIYADVGEAEKSFATYLNIKKILDESVFKSPGSYFEIDYEIAKNYAEEEKYNQALEVLEKALALEPQLNTELKFVKIFVDKAKKLKKSLQKQIKN